ncbi:MAG: phage minor head protein [Betaproteobacteria bacterium]
MNTLQHKAVRRRIFPRQEWIEQNRLRNNFERRLFNSLRRKFRQIGSALSVEYSQSNFAPSSLIFNSQIAETLIPHYTAVIEAFGLRVIRNREQKQETQFETLIREYIASYGAQRITQISSTTRKQIERIIGSGVSDSLSLDQIAKNIYDFMSGAFSRTRAATIARTETHNAASYANHLVHESFDVPLVKQWVSSNDDRAREAHRQANGQQADMNSPFLIGGLPMQYPGDPMGGASNVINCRCVLIYVEKEE